jgi:hypothetical protein
VRKHIRIEQQLKLHIESIEYQIEQMEHEQEKYTQQVESHDSDLQKQRDQFEEKFLELSQ